jgi:glycosyltransferase involved in cell wall biosynthesis
MRVAYLTNQYPKVSHSFIRREVQALERAGVEVSRYAVRRVQEALPEAADRDELARTRVVLERGARTLVEDTVRAAVTKPKRFVSALKLALRTGRHSDRGLLRQAAYFVEACAVSRWLEEEDVQHLHAHFGTNSTTVAMLAAELAGTTYSFTAHGPEEFDKPISIALADKIQRSAFVAGVSSFGRSQLLRHTPAQTWDKVQVVRCGVDAQFLEHPPTPVPASKRLVCVGRLCEQKGQLILIEAARLLAERGIEFELVFVGDGEMRAEVERAVARHGLASRVRITGWSSGDDVRKELEQGRALVLPSFAEGLPVVIMEAFALGRPVVSTYVAGIPELVRPGLNGWLVPAGSVDGLAKALEELLNTPEARLTEMGSEGRARVAALHESGTIAHGLRSLFERFSRESRVDRG